MHRRAVNCAAAVVLALAVLCMVWGVLEGPAQIDSVSAAEVSSAAAGEEETEQIEQILASMTIDEKVAVTALQAGADLLLMPENFAEAYTGVLEAIACGELTEERIDESLARILKVKMKPEG